MNFVDMLNFIIGLIHTLVRFVPLGFYFFTYFSSTIYKDLRSAILLIGLIINDLLGYLIKKYAKLKMKAPCAIFGKEGSNTELGFLPNAHTQIVTFVASFYFSDMYFKEKIDPIPFVFLLVLVFVTIWSRITIGCKEFKEIIRLRKIDLFFLGWHYFLIYCIFVKHCL